MKYILLTVLALGVLLCLGALLARLFEKATRGTWTTRRRIALSAVFGVIIALGAMAVYFGMYYPAGASAQRALASDGNVEVRNVEEGLLFDGKGESAALVFFPGAKVQTEAYAPLMRRIAEGGVDCVLVDPPLRMAIFGVSQGKQALDELEYEHWVVGGHSLGGVAAGSLAADAGEKVEGLVLLASYPTAELDPDLALLSIYGSEDSVLEAGAYDDGKAFWPAGARELVIEGGNHAGFGDYGAQSGDGTATITAQDQQGQTAQAVIDFAQNLEAPGAMHG